MSSMPAEQMGVPPIPSAIQSLAPSRLPDMHYYLSKGLEGVEHQEFCDLQSFMGAIESQAKKLRSANADEYPSLYMVFSPVTQDQLANIEHVRDTHYKSLRFMYLNDPKALIVKIVPSGPHEFATEAFISSLMEKVGGMGLRRALPSVGRTTYQGDSNGKQADGGFKPWVARPLETDWPTLVLECGVSESLQRLVVDAQWWLANSHGEVKIVLLFFVSTTTRTIHIQHWEIDNMPNLQLIATPTIKKTITINAQAVSGGTLRLDFQKLFLRPPVASRGEGDFTFTAQDLRDYYDDVWRAAQ